MSAADLAAAVELARAALPQYGIAADTELTLLKHRENVVLSLTAHGTDYVLRVHRRGYHSDAELECELDFVRALHREGVAVPRFVLAADGRGFCVVGADHPAGAHQVDLQHRLDNHGNFGDERTAVDGSATLDPADFAELGRLIAGVHDASERSGYTMSVPRDDWDLEGLVGPNFAWGNPLRLTELAGADREAVVAAMRVARSTLSTYGTPAHRFGPIHADLTPENVLRTPDGLVLIDFDDFAAGWHLFDLATALYFYTPHPHAAAYRTALFAGYEAVRPLDPEDHRVFPALLLTRALTYLGWAADRRGEPTAEWHATMVLPHVVALAHDLLATTTSPSSAHRTPGSPE
ncbi:phosphotransferase enzyme family protein [Leucobacter luti]|uniref:Ser/Thr protein kinase RdoA (MazF antagonist) n=1 Tax=Leucobacter luti TaxID=340320 RepID=A0A4Q7U8Q2_9MICO|nr:phosphotransferase [Leucobacter luti]MBL3700981.1 serine kinase [Leucobacter luti]RZT68798.1 Ser/Thr protein kinase RdoA (MazF antagonist) [Leucobacter luti]